MQIHRQRIFLKNNPVVEKLRFYIYASGTKSIDVYLKTIWLDTAYKNSSINNYKSYNLNFTGDSYFFEKKYGTFNLPDKEIIAASLNKCSNPSYIKFSANADSIHCRLEFNCPVKKEVKAGEEDEIIFTKVEMLSGYKNGINELQKKIESSFKKNFQLKQNSLTDSALLFTILIDNKESCLKRIELTEGNYSPFAQFIIDELKTACSWVPSQQGGRPVKSYTKIFIRLNKDNSITVVMP